MIDLDSRGELLVAAVVDDRRQRVALGVAGMLAGEIGFVLVGGDSWVTCELQGRDQRTGLDPALGHHIGNVMDEQVALRGTPARSPRSGGAAGRR